jgi:uncharacterized membrane protein YkvA (DUF1232 family)
MSSLINYPDDVTPELKRQIRESFEDAISRFDDDDADYVFKKSRRVIARLDRSDDWHVNLAVAAESLFGEFQLLCDDSNKVTDPAYRVIGAALFYLCNPFDVIPDHQPGRGYLDDAYVIDLCLAKIRKMKPSIFVGVQDALRQ